MDNINLINDGKINISVGKSRKEQNWINKEMTWSEFLTRVSKTTYTYETREEFKALSKAEQNEIKDVGGFVGGTLIDGKRKKNFVKSRELIALDVDNAFREIWYIVNNKFNFASCIYSTHNHSTDKPRYRLIIPLSRAVSSEEYEAIARKIADIIGLEYFDDTTYEPCRMMYWPSTSRGAEFVFKYKDDKWLNPQTILNFYDDWTNIEEWPRTKSIYVYKETDKKKLDIKDSKNKKGLVGAFCNSYTVHEAIEKYLKNIYTKDIHSNRYTYVNGSTSGGLVVYENGEFAYSHHSTDPAGGKLLNSFDLVRVHLFGDNLNNSFNRMINFIKDDEKVKFKIIEQNSKSYLEDFKIEYKEEQEDWLVDLQINSKGGYITSTENIIKILENDTKLKNIIALNEFSQRTMAINNLPWRDIKDKENGDIWSDIDDSGLRNYLENNYDIWSKEKVFDGLSLIAVKNKYNPIINYLEGITWDKRARLENLFIDYLGANNNEYTKTVTRKIFVAAIARVFQPGIKFDYMPVIIGEQGIGKSYLLDKLGGIWYSDSLTTVIGKDAYEQLQDCWIIEIAELAALRGSESDGVKSFLSKRQDIYRVAYGRRTEKFPRQCVFFGTTNNREFLKDNTGNRRFWPIDTFKENIKKDLWTELTEKEVNQIWAEAMYFYNKGESLYLENAIEDYAKDEQAKHTEGNCLEGVIREYLDIPLPKKWGKYDIDERKRYIHGGDFGKKYDGTEKRMKVCGIEIWMELLDGDIKKFNNSSAKEITDILRKLDGWKEYGGQLRFSKLYGKQRAFVRE